MYTEQYYMYNTNHQTITLVLLILWSAVGVKTAFTISALCDGYISQCIYKHIDVQYIINTSMYLEILQQHIYKY